MYVSESESDENSDFESKKSHSKEDFIMQRGYSQPEEGEKPESTEKKPESEGLKIDDDVSNGDSSSSDSENVSDDMEEVSERVQGFTWDLTNVDIEMALHSFYEDYKPENKAKVEVIAEMYKGDEILMFRILCDKGNLTQDHIQTYLDLAKRPRATQSGGNRGTDDDASSASSPRSVLKTRSSFGGDKNVGVEMEHGEDQDSMRGDGTTRVEKESRRVSISTEHNQVEIIENRSDSRRENRRKPLPDARIKRLWRGNISREYTATTATTATKRGKNFARLASCRKTMLEKSSSAKGKSGVHGKRLKQKKEIST